jgi:hypothetical protein
MSKKNDVGTEPTEPTEETNVSSKRKFAATTASVATTVLLGIASQAAIGKVADYVASSISHD